MTFESRIGKAPSPSCLIIELRDVGLQDVAAPLYASDKIDVTNVTFNGEYEYVLESKKPLMGHSGYSVSARLNLGWCPSADMKKWIRPSDFLTDALNSVVIKDDVDVYEKNLKMKLFRKLKRAHPPTVDELNSPL